MCGIFCTFKRSAFTKHDSINLSDIYEICKNLLHRRGPDFHSDTKFKSETYEFLFAASVLWLQGANLTHQPVETDNSIFVYNGDIFGGNLISDDERQERGDTYGFLKCLEASDNITATLSYAQGPYAFVYLNKKTMELYFARDRYGRRSLIIGTHLEAIVLTSAFPKHNDFNGMELPALGVFCMDLKSNKLHLYPWPFKHSNFNTKVQELETFLGMDIIIKPTTTIHQKLFVDLSDSYSNIYKKLLATDIHIAFQILLNNKDWLDIVIEFHRHLEMAVKKRIITQPPYCHNCVNNRISCCHATAGILFSGGIDCAILAVLAHKFIDKDRPIDLLNVAFRTNAPDRTTGAMTFNELKELCPNRVWNFVEIDVTSDQLENERNNHIKHLIYPVNTILDDSLGCALWFASRGVNETYRSPCRVVLVGSGADELFGGYTKHRAALKRGGWFELNQSLDNDWQNISHRNLARDDRVVSDHGRQLRTPYLDENVVEFVRGLQCWQRTCPSEDLPQGLGEKILLRSLGYHLGLVNAAGFKKQALQFGSRIANSKENAHNISPRL